ncbi:MAG: DUF1080 domain-containing protein [Aureliella sp.]
MKTSIPFKLARRPVAQAWFIAACMALLLTVSGCGSTKEEAASAEDATASVSEVADSEDDPTANVIETETEAPIGEPQIFEIDAKTLQAAALDAKQLEDGWVRMFDGQSLFGWFVVGKANWSINDGILKVSRGERSYMCSSFQISDFEFKVDFRSDADSNSGIFLRTGPQPENVAEDCLELNIAPTDNPFPTGSFVQRKKLEPEELDDTLGGKFDSTSWHTYHVRLIGDSVEVFLDDKQIMELTDFKAKPIGHISLQHNSGRVEFRNMLLRPTKPETLQLGEDWESDWEKSVKEGAELDVAAVEDGLRLKGGLGQIQSKADFGDFFLHASYTLAKPEVNSGLFFRCIRDDMLNGYECQVNHAVEDGDYLRPADAGAGAIFRRQNARVVMGDGTSKTHISILANGPQIVTWVNGIQVADFVDSRAPDENPRRGLRLDPGPLSIQAHDPGTEVIFHEISIAKP